MTSDEIIRYALSFLGGGTVAALGNWIRAARSERRAREADYLHEQLRLLYGPLSFFARQNEQLFQHVDNMRTLYQQHFSGRFSEDPITQGNLEKQAEAMIDLSNTYVKCVVGNNGRIMTILENNWHLVDPDHADEFSRFQIHHTRFLTEVEQQRRENLPMQVKLKLGDISFMHPKMIEQIKGAVQRKQSRLKDLRTSWISRFRTLKGESRIYSDGLDARTDRRNHADPDQRNI